MASVIDESSPHYVPSAERIAVSDNDGTLWCEKPMYIQLDFILRKLAARAESDPSLRSHQPWQAAWEKDFAWLGGAITQHYQGDDSALHVLLGGILALSDGQAIEQVKQMPRCLLRTYGPPGCATLALTPRCSHF